MYTLTTCSRCQHNVCAKKISLFETLNDADLAKVMSIIERKTFKKGDFIFKEGQLAERLYIVNGGSFKVFTQTKEGDEVILYLLTEGDYFGDLNLLKSEPLSYSAVALEPTHMCTIKKERMDVLLSDYPELYPAILESAYKRIMGLETLLQTVNAKDVDSRIATLLLQLAEQFGVMKPSGIEVPLKITREEMARLIGLTRETVSRKLSQFQTNGYISFTDNKSIFIKDMNALTEDFGI